MAFSRLLHARLLLTLVLGFGALALWSLLRAVRNSERSPHFTAALGMGQITLMLEGVLGMVLLFGGPPLARPALHLLYGAATLLALPIAFMYTDHRRPRQRHLAIALACGMVVALALRGQATGH